MTETGAERGGDPVRAALVRLDTLGERPVAEHVGVFEAVLGDLEAALGSADEQGATQADGYGERDGHIGREGDT